jgi:hypothetical protein
MREAGFVHHHGERQNTLHGALAEGRRITHDHGASVVLQSADQDFRCGSAEPAGQHDEGPVVLDGGIVVGAHVDLA